jgi:nucleotide-binding universal stress UspA family protein
MLFKKIGLALTFSPTSIALLAEVNRLQRLFDSEIVLIHAGEQNSESEQKMKRIITESGLDPNCYTLHWKKGEPVKVILNACEEKKVDLLVSGALEKENFLKYYLGSVARTLVREATCSMLLLPHPLIDPKPFKNIAVSFDYSELGEKTIKISHELSIIEQSEELTIIREFQLPGLAITISESGSTDETELQKKQMLEEEEIKLGFFIKELNLTGVKIKLVCLCGRQGWTANNYVQENGMDLFVVSSSMKRLKLFDRIFQHDLEFIIKDLPSSVLIIKSSDYLE